jgi:hypothetical protein
MRMIFRCDPALVDHLPRPVPARAALPDWLRAMPASAHSDLHGREIRTVKQCPPFVDAMAYGVMIPLPCDVSVDRGAFSWDWDIPEPATAGHPRAPLSFHVAAQVEGAPFARDGQAALKFNSFWTIELDEGWSLFVWTMTDFSGVLPKGTPVAQCFAVPRIAPELVFEGFDRAHSEAYTKTVAEVLASPGVYRKRFRARRGRLTT